MKGLDTRDSLSFLGFESRRQERGKPILKRVIVFCAIISILWWWPWRRHKTPARGEIQWFKCKDYDSDFECGTLYAPLDYTNLDDDRNASIAVIRYKAGKGKTPRSEVLGSILLNPGGPGSSGLAFITRKFSNASDLNRADTLDTKLGSKYDLVSFDPRGTGATWPQVKCFHESHAQVYYKLLSENNGYPGQHGKKPMKHEIGTLLAQLQLVSDVCFAHEDAELLNFMSTPFVVRDMQLLHRALGDAKLNYWGFSYGSVIGSTYADTFPQDVNRLVIDGVVDAPNYYAGESSDSMTDTEAELDHFFTECVQSGTDFCKLGKLASSAQELKDVVFTYANNLRIHPIPVASSDPPQLLTYSALLSTLFRAMYTPVDWRELADNLYEAIANNKTSLLVQPLSLHPKKGDETEAFEAIACSDSRQPAAKADGSSMWDIEKYEKHISPMYKDSPHFSPFFGFIAPLCSGSWQIRGAERHWGNFTSETSFPILALGNDYDPVTPGRYADKMASLFPNAVSVQREGYGHGSVSQPSKCIDTILQDYFLNGVVPAPGTRCGVDNSVFGPWENEAAVKALSLV